MNIREEARIKKMKKHIALFLALTLVMSIALSGCGGDKKHTDNSSVVVGITQ